MIMADVVDEFALEYKPLHGPLAIGISCIGATANIINVLVLTRAHMRHNAINILLCGLSASQLLLLLNYIPFTVYTTILDSKCALYTKTHSWLLFLLVNSNMNVIWHTIALVHTSLLAIFRYISIHWPHKPIINTFKAKLAVISTYTLLPIICSPFYFNSKIVQYDDFNGLINGTEENCMVIPNNTIYKLSYSANALLFKYNFWFFAIGCKITPCLCLTVLSCLLIYDLKKVEKRRKLMKCATGLPYVARSKQEERRESNQQRSRVSQMLLIILSLFIIVEFPQGVLNLFVAFENTTVQRIYFRLGDFFEMLTILYSSVNFVMYCGMSSQFRATFRTLMFPCIGSLVPGRRRSSQAQTQSLSTNNNTRKSSAMSKLNPKASVRNSVRECGEKVDSTIAADNNGQTDDNHAVPLIHVDISHINTHQDESNSVH